MSSEFTFGDNSDKSSFFFFDFFTDLVDRDFTEHQIDHSDNDTVTTGRTTGAD